MVVSGGRHDDEGDDEDSPALPASRPLAQGVWTFSTKAEEGVMEKRERSEKRERNSLLFVVHGVVIEGKWNGWI